MSSFSTPIFGRTLAFTILGCFLLVLLCSPLARSQTETEVEIEFPVELQQYTLTVIVSLGEADLRGGVQRDVSKLQ